MIEWHQIGLANADGGVCLKEIGKLLEGDRVRVQPDLIVVNDGLSLETINKLSDVSMSVEANRVLVIFDHDIPAGSFETAKKQKKLIAFAKSKGIKLETAKGIGYHYLTNQIVGEGMTVAGTGEHFGMYTVSGGIGIKLSEEALVSLLTDGQTSVQCSKTIKVEVAGQLKDGISNTDAAIGLYKAVKALKAEGACLALGGQGYESLDVDSKKVIASLATRAGSGVCVPGDMVDASTEVVQYDLSTVTKAIIEPGAIDNIRGIDGLEKQPVDACFVGGCLGGNIDSIRHIAKMTAGQRIKHGVRVLVAPDTNETYLKAEKEGLIGSLIDAGVQICNPGCSSCLTTSIGVIGDGEVMVSTGSYNYAGCCGTDGSKVYIASTEVVAQAAMTGYIEGGQTHE